MKLTDFKAYNEFVNAARSGLNSIGKDTLSLLGQTSKLYETLIYLSSPYPEELYSSMQSLVAEIEERYFSRENKTYLATITSEEKPRDVFSYTLIPVVPFIKPLISTDNNLGVSTLDELYEFLFKFISSKQAAIEAYNGYYKQKVKAFDTLKRAKEKDIFGSKKPLFKKEYNAIKSNINESQRIFDELDTIVTAVEDYISNIQKGNESSPTLFDKIVPMLNNYRNYHNFIAKPEAERVEILNNLKTQLDEKLKLITIINDCPDEKINDPSFSPDKSPLELTASLVSNKRLNEVLASSLSDENFEYLSSIEEFVGLIEQAIKGNPNPEMNDVEGNCNLYLANELKRKRKPSFGFAVKGE